MSSKRGLDGNLGSAVTQVERRQAAVLEKAELHDGRAKAEAAEAKRLRDLAGALGRAISALRDAEAASSNGPVPPPADRPSPGLAEYGAHRG
jgi:hypothetical protein